MPTAIFDRFDVVVVPFPFNDKAADRRRPALVLSDAQSFNRASGQSVMAMITSSENAPWPLDTVVTDLRSAGLPAASVVRMKLFTLDHRFVLRKTGRLAMADVKSVQQALKKALKTTF